MITVADYIGYSDRQGAPMGHPVKVMGETAALLLPFEAVCIAAPEKHLAHIRYQGGMPCIGLKHSVGAYDRNKVGNLFKKWRNLGRIFSQASGEVWFVTADFSLFAYLFCHPGKRKRSILTLCYQPLACPSGWRKHIISAVLRDVRLIAATNAHFLPALPGNVMLMPDYCYDPGLYAAYSHGPLAERTVCVGMMSPSKKLEELVQAFSGVQNELVIAGDFSQHQERYGRLMTMKGSNVTLINRRMENAAYYRMLADAKYVVLPYDMALYNERTSGILLETIFLHRVPVAPKRLLAYNGIAGIGYEQISDIPLLLGRAEVDAAIVRENDRLVKERFDLDAIRENVKRKLRENR
ncbi:MAG: hypothetical protein ACI4WX_03825 [Aristaeellaceae bacterium]